MPRPCLLISLLLFLSFSVFAEEQPGSVSDHKFRGWLWDNLIDGASVTAGIGGQSVVIDVTRQGTNDHGIIEENKEELFLLYSTKARYFENSNIGYAWLLNLSTFSLKEQELSNGDILNLGTKVDGFFAYTVPTFFYNIGDRYQGHYFRTGIGLGIGLTKFDGDIILTKSVKKNDRVSISNGASNVILALGLFIDYQWENFTIRLSNSGPNLEFNGLDINVSSLSLVLGYTFYLN